MLSSVYCITEETLTSFEDDWLDYYDFICENQKIIGAVFAVLTTAIFYTQRRKVSEIRKFQIGIASLQCFASNCSNNRFSSFDYFESTKIPFLHVLLSTSVHPVRLDKSVLIQYTLSNTTSFTWRSIKH